MTGKEKMLNTLNHKSGKVPVDFGSLLVTGIHASCVEELRKHYGLNSDPVKIIDPYQMLGEIADDLKEAMGIDSQGIPPFVNMFGVENVGWMKWRAPWGQDLLIPEGLEIHLEGNDLVTFPQGDTSAPPSGKMPEGGFFFDSIIRQQSFDEDNLRADDNLEEFAPVSQKALDYYTSKLPEIEASGRCGVTDFGGTGLGDIAMVPGPGLKHPKGIRDITEWYMSTILRQDLLHEIFEKQTDIALKNLEKLYKTVGEAISVVMICGTDFGTQSSSFCSTDTFDSLYLPHYQKVNGWIHQHTGWKTFKHSCGAVADFMPHFIDADFDIINPVQLSAAGMDAKMLKREFGNDLVFWGGGVDTQKTLPFGTPEEVRKEVLERCGILSESGGFVFNAIHNVQAKTPTENIIAMIDAVHEFNGDR
ncbi:MAG: methyltransferase [Spirochaetales bacterium]|jgi:hypothetical protein|nr:methyltransferase [Spirochaetales bacterium]